MPKGNPNQPTWLQAQNWADQSHRLGRVREAAERDKRIRFTSLLHHVTPRLLYDCYKSLKKTAASGVDEMTWLDYQEGLEGRLLTLHERLHDGRYRAKPSKRIYIAKGDGRQRPIGIAALEDKIAQAAIGRVLESIYEADFLGISYGFRPGRSQHDALDAVYVGIQRRKIGWILDADLKSFFDTISHEWMLKFLEHRIADRRILRLVAAWLKAGVSEDGEWSATTVGTPQGAVISPLLANIFLHYVLDPWARQWRERHVQGEMIFVRYADDFIVGFQSQGQAERFHRALQERLDKFSLRLQERKTRIIEFGRFAAENRKRRGQGKPETFDFLGLTHFCGRTRKNRRFTIGRKPNARKVRAKLAKIKERVMRDRHKPMREQGRYVRDCVRGIIQYYSVPGAWRWVDAIRSAIRRIWIRALKRRSQKFRMERIYRWLKYWMPQMKVTHPYPDQRLRV